jgi:hypothetical protein
MTAAVVAWLTAGTAAAQGTPAEAAPPAPGPVAAPAPVAAPEQTPPASGEPAPSPAAPAPAAAEAPSSPVAATPSATAAAVPAAIPAAVTTTADVTPEAAPAIAPADQSSTAEPLAGYTGDTAFLRSADNNFQFFPNGRLQVDGYFFKRDTNSMPTPSILLRRARLEVAGWVGPWFFYSIAGDFALTPPSSADPVGQSWVNATDDFVGIAPWENLAMLQVGQFDAPFTLENRTSDKYFDFMERSVTVRAFGIPTNKETGAMVHGLLPDKVAYYSVGVFDGDGQNFRNTDSKFDVMGRAWVAPFSIASTKALEDVTIGGSFWVGKRGDSGLPLAKQTTQGGFSFLDTSWKLPGAAGSTTTTPLELHQKGKLDELAFELNVPILHRFGARVEYVHKSQELAVDDTTAASSGTLTPMANAKLVGSSVYGEVWYWLVGDDTILPAPGLELPPRYKKFETKAPRHGVMLAARLEHLDEKVSVDESLAKDPVAGTHRMNAFAFGANYWYSKRFRGTFNYVLNTFQGDAPGVSDVKKKLGGHSSEHEFLFRLAVAL